MSLLLSVLRRIQLVSGGESPHTPVLGGRVSETLPELHASANGMGLPARAHLHSLALVVLAILAAGVAEGQSVNAVVNSASGLIQGLPNSGIAQGSIFLVVGTTLGPSTLAIASTPFQSTSVGGTSVAVVVGTTTVNALMYYSSATQVAALMPSNTPTGLGTLTVTYNGTPSGSVTVSVVANNFGIFTEAQNGQGIAVATNPDYSLVSAIPGTGSLGGGGPDTYNGAANPGDTLTLWGTGLGPVSGSDAAGVGLSQPITIPSSTPLTMWVGGVAATVTYHGRSGYIGEDQINFVVPSNAPTGCAVPLAVQIGSYVSNFTSIAIGSGSRTCPMQNPSYSSSALQKLTTATTPLNYASFQLGRQIASSTSSGVSYDDTGVGNFAQISVSPANQPNVLASLDFPPFGTCSMSNSNVTPQPLFTVITGIDAGATTVTAPAPDFPTSLKEQRGTGQATTYSAVFSPTGVYFSGGAYTITAAGGTTAGYTDIGSYTIPFTITQTPTWTSADQARIAPGVTRANGVTINWTGGSSAYWVEISGSGITTAPDVSNGSVYATFACWVPSSLNTFVIPASVMLAMPGGIEGEIDFRPTLPPSGFSASNLDIGLVLFQYETSFFLPFN
jgi:uncharacterized protein (TIGR03437 family)